MHLAQTCSSTATSCWAGASRGPRIQLSNWPMLIQSSSECCAVCVCVSYLSVCSMLTAGWEREKGEGMRRGGGAWPGSREGSDVEVTGDQAVTVWLGYKGKWAFCGLTPPMRAYTLATSQGNKKWLWHANEAKDKYVCETAFTAYLKHPQSQYKFVFTSKSPPRYVAL